MANRRGASALVVFLTAVGLALLPAGGASAATVIDGPIDLGTAADFGVLGASGVSNTGSSVIDGDVGVSPGTALGGFPPGTISGASTFHQTDGVAGQAQLDLGAAMVTAASLTPTVSGLANLTGMTLVPGVYAGGALELDAGGTLTLDGGPTAVWVFTAASTLVTGSASTIAFTGGAGACNVFWRVGSSATFGTGSDFAGTVMAEQSITATTGTDVVGRLLAAAGAVTLDTTDVTIPTGCTVGTVSTSGAPEITSGEPTDGTVGTPYAFTITATGTAPLAFAVDSGALPAGLVLDATSGLISGTPTAEGASAFRVTVSNGTAPDTSVLGSIVIAAAGVAPAAAPTLPPTGVPAAEFLPAAMLFVAGAAFLLVAARRQARRAL